MTEFKLKIKTLFEEELNRLNINQNKITKDRLEVKLNKITENIINSLFINSNITTEIQSINNNINMSEYDLKSDQLGIPILTDNSYMPSNDFKTKQPLNRPIPDNFILSYEMKQFAKLKFVDDVESVFEEFKVHYQGNGQLNYNWKKVWEKWVLRSKRFKTHLPRTTINKDMILDDSMRKYANKYIKKDDIDIEFIKFKNHHLASGYSKASWIKMWENWCIKHKEFKPKESLGGEEKANYRWNFRKAKETSDKIKDWLEFEKKVRWLEHYYMNNIPIKGIGWQKVLDPNFNREEILLYKIDSDTGSYMLQHKTNDIIDAEVLDND
jgi:hypothetical protein